MTHEERLAKAAEIKAKHKSLCEQRGSEFHPNHPNCPQKQGKPPLSDNLICFEGSRDCHFVSFDAIKAKEALEAIKDKHAPSVSFSTPPDSRKAAHVHDVVTYVHGKATPDDDRLPELTFDRSHLNDVLRALEMAGLAVSLVEE